VTNPFPLSSRANHNSGDQVLDFLLAEMENQVGTLVFILAGYNKQMEMFFEHHPGLPSRVPYSLKFADYTDVELLTILGALVEKQYSGQEKVEDGIRGLYARISIRRLSRGRGREGFGNARVLQNMFSRVAQIQAERLERNANNDGSLMTLYSPKRTSSAPTHPRSFRSALLGRNYRK
jgi:hypothetical protein